VTLTLGYKASNEQFGPRELLELVKHAEDRGFEVAGVSDHLQPWRHNGGHAPAVLPWLGAAAATTSTITLGTSVLTPTMRYHPAIIAQAFATLACLAPGRVFRRDTPDPTHNPMFFQVEGLCVDRGITMAHLKGTVGELVRRMFGPNTVTRFRPSYFPFTEPSAEFDFSCFKCGGSGCRICKNSGWIELGGSGMVHPNVLRIVGVDPQEFSGFAFGFGIDRMCGLMYSLDDIRLLFENDVRFLEQFS